MRWEDPNYYEKLIYGSKKDNTKAKKLIREGKIKIKVKWNKYFKEYYIEKNKDKEER